MGCAFDGNAYSVEVAEKGLTVSQTKRALFICGSINQTTQMTQIADELPEIAAYFSPYYEGAFVELMRKTGLSDFTIAGNKAWRRCIEHLQSEKRPLDIRGQNGPYDLVVTCTDLMVPPNIKGRPLVVVQEGMMEPINFMFHVVRKIKWIPRWLANTSATGLSGAYDRFCVASQGYRDQFVSRGVDASRIEVTGIPNFDNCAKYLENSFPHKGYVLVCTSDARETFKRENRPEFLQHAVRVAAGRPMIFKLHPNENIDRAMREIKAVAPEALIFHEGRAEEMVANAAAVVTQFSSLVYVGIALGKEVYSSFPMDDLRRLCPIQNHSAAANIARVCREVLQTHAH